MDADREREGVPTVEDLLAQTRRLIDRNRALEQRLQVRRLWRTVGIALMASFAFYAWSIHGLLAENAVLLRANTELVQTGNALLRAIQKKPEAPAAAAPAAPRPRPDVAPQAMPDCDSSTRWVPGFPGPRVSTKRT